MTFDLGEPERGCLLLADITGYTRYMGETELTHAQDVVADLLETIISAVEPVFNLSKLEGDAAFAYANQNAVNPSMMLDTVESTYFAFQKRLRDISHATSCECNACVRIPGLDLKFFVHDGEYMVRKIGRSEELTGPDVIKVHRLAKGTAGKTINKPGYAVYTKETVDAMAMNPSILGFQPYTEKFEDIGEVDVFVQDLGLRWTFEQERNRDYVTAAQAVHQASFETPVPPAVVWDHLTDSNKRPRWQRAVTEIWPQTEGRQGVGTINHCMHGPDVIIEHVADWQPFSYITRRYEVGDVADWAWTFQLDELDDGTRLSVLISDPGHGHWDEIGPIFIDSLADQMVNLEKLLSSVAETP